MNLIGTPKIALQDPKRQNQKQKDRAILPKSKLIVHVCRFKKVFEPDPSSKTKQKIISKPLKSIEVKSKMQAPLEQFF